MYECVNPSHPDKIADRIAGAIVDYAYSKWDNPKIAVEILIGHNQANVIVECSNLIPRGVVENIIYTRTGIKKLKYTFSYQDSNLAHNQEGKIRCGDNGIFKGVPLSTEELALSLLAKEIYKLFPYDGKYIYDLSNEKVIICQSNVHNATLKDLYPYATINPLGEWIGGLNVDSGSANRKLGSDMGNSVTGGGLHGKDLSKSDVSINIYLFLKAQKYERVFECSCAIGDEIVDNRPYSEIVEIAKRYIQECGGFEKFAEWGLIGGPSPSKFFDLL